MTRAVFVLHLQPPTAGARERGHLATGHLIPRGHGIGLGLGSVGDFYQLPGAESTSAQKLEIVRTTGEAALSATDFWSDFRTPFQGPLIDPFCVLGKKTSQRRG